MATTDGTRQQEITGRDQVLVEPTWLEAHLGDPGLCVVEVDVSPAAYDEGHIDGAVLWNVYRDLKDTEYRLVDHTAIGRLLARSGIEPASTVVFYGYAPAMGLWLMKLYGHVDARILNCGRQAWRDSGRPWASTASAPGTTSYPLSRPDPRVRAGYAAVLDAIGDPTTTIVDVRTPAEFRGERFWPSGGLEAGGRAGHVPGAVALPLEGVQDDQGAFRPEADLRQVFAPLDLAGSGELIPYCTIGGRAATAWFVLTYLLGRDHVRVYDGSWAEWGRMPSAPVMTGEAATAVQ